MIVELARAHILIEFDGRKVWINGDMFASADDIYVLFKKHIIYVRIVNNKVIEEGEVKDENVKEQILKAAQSELLKRGWKSEVR